MHKTVFTATLAAASIALAVAMTSTPAPAGCVGSCTGSTLPHKSAPAVHRQVQGGNRATGKPANGKVAARRAMRDPQSGLPTGKRMHKPLVVN